MGTSETRSLASKKRPSWLMYDIQPRVFPSSNSTSTRRPRCSLMRRYWPLRRRATFRLVRASPSRTRTLFVVLYLAPRSSGLWFSTRNCTGSSRQKTKLQKPRAATSTNMTPPFEGRPQNQRRAGPKGKVPVLDRSRKKWCTPRSSTASSTTSSRGTDLRCKGNSSARASASLTTRRGIMARTSKTPSTRGADSIQCARCHQSLYSSTSQPAGCRMTMAPSSIA
mmetsp:Transcript_15541/g.48923  ORF Transcript_15541/g.48923 Transcript_15541/m.48923 type:complete len:224 (-) Transcript_15541:240-911(-)